jgi:hypothetical protein
MTDKARLGKDPFKASGVNSLIQDTREEGFRSMKKWEYKEVLSYEGFVNLGMDDGDFKRLARVASHWIGSARKTTNEAIDKFKEQGLVSALSGYMNALGAEGWELVTVMDEPKRELTKLFFKRPAAG